MVLSSAVRDRIPAAGGDGDEPSVPVPTAIVALDGDIAAALVAQADELLAEPPQILPAEVLAAKL